MAKKRKRVYEYAKDLGISSAELMHKLKFMGVRVANTFNAVDEETIDNIKRQMGLHLFDEEPELTPVEIRKQKKKLAAQKKKEQRRKEEEKKKQQALKQAEEQKKLLIEAEKASKSKAGQGQQQQARYGPKVIQRAPRKPAPRPNPPGATKPKAEDSRQRSAPKRQPRPEDGKPGPKPLRKYRPDDRKPRPAGATGGKRPPVKKDEREKLPDKKSFQDQKRKSDYKGKKKRGGDTKKSEDVGRDKRPGKKGKGGEKDIYASPKRRLEAIKQNRFQQSRKGTKTTFFKKRSKKGKKKTPEEKAIEREAAALAARKHITISGPMTVKELSHEMGIRSSDIIMHLMQDMSLMTTLNQSLDPTIIALVAEHFECNFTIEENAPEKHGDIDVPAPEPADDRHSEERAPVVTVMGHVDHGKTRLLDTIRKTNVIDTESGGITQHIGAYQVEHNGRKITFLDTPGHAAFTKLRARGAQVTDLAVLVVAADDGIMPQTVEAIDHARAANVPILVAINKIDKTQAKPDRVRQQLVDHQLVPEDWGGDTVCVEISAKMNTNIEDLLEMIFLVTDMQELKANPKRQAVGTIIEAKLDKGKGPVATVLVQNGTLRIGDNVVVGEVFGKVRAMENDRAERITEAPPSTPVEIIGLSKVPEPGDQLIVLEDEKTSKEIALKRHAKSREEKLHYESRITLEALFSRIKDNKINEFEIVLKGDVQGSLEALKQSLQEITHEEVRVNVIRSGVGDIRETDIMLAAASNAIVMGYRVNIIPDAKVIAQNEGVEVRFYEVIYDLTNEVRSAMAGMLAPVYEKILTGKAQVRQVFESSKHGRIAGCYVTDGEIISTGLARIIRRDEEIFDGKLSSLKRFKDNVKSVRQGMECGITLDGFEKYEVDDIIEVFKLVRKVREL